MKASTAKGEARGDEELHVVTYHIPTATVTDHGPVRFSDGSHPTYVNSLAVHVKEAPRTDSGGSVGGCGGGQRLRLELFSMGRSSGGAGDSQQTASLSGGRPPRHEHADLWTVDVTVTTVSTYY